MRTIQSLMRMRSRLMELVRIHMKHSVSDELKLDLNLQKQIGNPMIHQFALAYI
jgi:hypothetical protein